eukprot:tig00021014_g17087.t1
MAPYSIHATIPNRRRLSLTRVLSTEAGRDNCKAAAHVALPLETGFGYGTISLKSARLLSPSYASPAPLRAARSPARPAVEAVDWASPSERPAQQPNSRVDVPSVLLRSCPSALERVAAVLPAEAAGRVRRGPMAFRAVQGELPDVGHLSFDSAVFDACVRGLHRFVLIVDLFSVCEVSHLRTRFHPASLVVGGYFDRFHPESSFLFAVEKEASAGGPPRSALMRPAPVAYPRRLFNSLPSPGSPAVAGAASPRRLSLDSPAPPAGFRLSATRPASAFSPDLAPLLHGTYATLSARAANFEAFPAWARVDGAVVASVEVAYFP